MRTLTLRRSLTALAVLSALSAQAATLRVANQGDALSMDPHSLNETLQISVVSNVYEPLVTRGRDYKLAPALATSWKQTSPTVWRFELRKGVTFHDGKPFTADDVIFSYERAAGDGSDMKSYVGQIKEIKKINDHTLDFVTKAPFPILPELFTGWMIMSKKWCEENQAINPVDRRKGIENAASFRANGTGPYRVRERQPGVRTSFVRNGSYWGKVDGNVDEVIFTPIGNDSTRIAALLSGEVDVMDPIPVQDVERVKANANLKVMQAPELRVIFLGMDQKRDELLFSNIKGKNPFKDVRVRKAFYQAIDIETIKSRVMRGASAPIAQMYPPQVRGFAPDLTQRLPYDVEAAKKLLTEAGYPHQGTLDYASPTVDQSTGTLYLSMRTSIVPGQLSLPSALYRVNTTTGAATSRPTPPAPPSTDMNKTTPPADNAPSATAPIRPIRPPPNTSRQPRTRSLSRTCV